MFTKSRQQSLSWVLGHLNLIRNLKFYFCNVITLSAHLRKDRANILLRHSHPSSARISHLQETKLTQWRGKRHSREAVSRSASREALRILQNQKLPGSDPKTPPPASVLSQTNPIHIIPTNANEIHFLTVLSTTSSSSKRYLSSRFSNSPTSHPLT
jgi:hypothetical protein